MCGTIAYSEGINDDVNKFVWAGQDWDSSSAAVDTLRDYCRLFIDGDRADELAQAFLALEKNWVGPLAINSQIEVTLRQWEVLAARLPEAAAKNYRFQMGLLRANYDAYVKRRLIHETELERRALAVLRAAPAGDELEAIGQADAILAEAQTRPVGIGYKQKCEELSDTLFLDIGSQLTVKKHGAQSRTRGAFMDGIDEPLNDARWLRAQFKIIRELQAGKDRRRELDNLLHRTDPGPGDFMIVSATPPALAGSSTRWLGRRIPTR